ncbi:peroxidase family protein [Pseudomonas fluorescens]|uniref:peroxidase family protein n=1 Tax=Pseudomonas fluorescens TaxID=294 RepID=UPI00124996FC|nr:peroxidase family protein [Pseudomonas fluorescens]CAG8866454.1 hypothetical protein PS861_01471 [Pseudomonas fluorescens]
MSIFDEVLGGISSIPLLGKELNRVAINHIASRTAPRPRSFSLWSSQSAPVPPAIGEVSDYTSWPGLTDRSFSGRHLPPATPHYLGKLTASPLDLLSLFKRSGEMKIDRSSVLFMFFAQWFTDSVLRVDPIDRRRNTSNHDIDLCQIYGLKEETTNILRSHHEGKLRCRISNKESFLDYLYEQNGDNEPLVVKDEYKGLPYIGNLDAIFGGIDIGRRRKAYATGLERGNSSIGYVAISTLFMREHNRICDNLRMVNSTWDDERLFQTARMINIVLLMKVVIEDYINHIAGSKIFKMDHEFAEEESWYRTNWIAIEFDILYRWHSLVPDDIKINGDFVNSDNYRHNNILFEQIGILGVLNAASSQPAGKIGLFNSPDFLAQAELATLTMSRAFRLRSYNDYRAQFGLDRLRYWNDLNGDSSITDELKKHYNSVDEVEFMVGLMAEGHSRQALFGDLLSTMVAYDAITQIFTNPLLSRNIFNEQTFSKYGFELIAKTTSVQDIAARNISGEVVAKLES